MIKTKVILSAIAATALSVSSIAATVIAPAAAQTTAENILHEGAWTKKSFSSKGTWSIVERDGARYVKLSSDFRTRNAPDLKIFLSPTSASATTGSNATQGSILVSPLRSNSGAQSYRIPDGVELSDFASILIHCEAYSKLWSASDL